MPSLWPGPRERPRGERTAKRTFPTSAMSHLETTEVVRAAGVEPARALRPYGFSYHFGFRRRRLAFVVWTIPSP